MTYFWAEFTVRSSGALQTWHLVHREEDAHRGLCGRLLKQKPDQTSERPPKAIRGVCRQCDRLSRIIDLPDTLRRF